MRLRIALTIIGIGAGLGSSCSASRSFKSTTWPRYSITSAQVWRVNLPRGERMDASGLSLTSGGELLTISDRSPEVYRIQAPANAAEATLIPLTDGFQELRPVGFPSPRPSRYDLEGITRDPEGRIYLCEEQNRWILRLNPEARTIERLGIDWSPVEKYFSPVDSNASFEGVAVGDGRLFVANERQQGRIIVVDLKTLHVIDDFAVRSSVHSLWGPQYSDLCWFHGQLFVLMREDHVVLRVNPRSHAVLAEYDFRDMELAPENEYRRTYWFTGVMEGLAVDGQDFWLITDNNGLGRKASPSDIRPTLFRCRRPDPE